MTIKQLLGSEQTASKGKEKERPREFDKEKREPKKLDEGVIPASPELSSKIANVLQLENDLKRRKFELEKRAGARTIPPPPVRPGSDAEKVKEEESDKVDRGRMGKLPEKGEKEPSDIERGSIETGKEENSPEADEARITEGSEERPISEAPDHESRPERARAEEKKVQDQPDERAETKQEKEEKGPKEKKKRRGIFGWFSR
jgi:hypothetical protein